MAIWWDIPVFMNPLKKQLIPWISVWVKWWKLPGKNGYDVMIIADHGNADHAVNADGSPNTAHSLNPVPCILVTDDYQEIGKEYWPMWPQPFCTSWVLNSPEEMTGKVWY